MELTDKEIDLIKSILSEFVRDNIWDGDHWNVTFEERELFAKLGIDLVE